MLLFTLHPNNSTFPLLKLQKCWGLFPLGYGVFSGKFCHFCLKYVDAAIFYSYSYSYLATAVLSNFSSYIMVQG